MSFAMKFRFLTVVVGVSSACNLSADLSANLSTVHPPYFVPHVPGELAVELKYVAWTGSGGKNVGFILKGPSGNNVTHGVCKLTGTQSPYAIGFHPQVTCPIPAMDIGKYPLFLSGDASCGPWSYNAADVDVEVIEPAHVMGIAPTHGPKSNETKVTIAGSNIGGPHVFCKFTFGAGQGASLSGDGSPLGCSMTMGSYPAFSVTATSAECIAPKWPGPLQQCGMGGCHPVPGAVCDRKVRVQLTNEAKVYSIEPSFYFYDEALMGTEARTSELMCDREQPCSGMDSVHGYCPEGYSCERMPIIGATLSQCKSGATPSGDLFPCPKETMCEGTHTGVCPDGKKCVGHGILNAGFSIYSCMAPQTVVV